MKKSWFHIVLIAVCQLLFVSSISFASLPVKYTSEACVSGGKVYTLNQGKRQYDLELPKGFNLSPYEGKRVLLEGELTPGDYFVPRDKTLKVLGPCNSGASMPAAAAAPPGKPAPQPAKPSVQPPKPVAAPQPAPAAPQSTKPVAQQPAKPASQPPKPAAPQPAPQKPQAGPSSPADCKRNCQRQYDDKIRNCAGYQLGNTAPACKDPLTRELQSCMQSCR